MKSSLSQWAIRVLYCEREIFLIKELQTKIFHLGQCNFVSNLGTEKKTTGRWNLQSVRGRSAQH